MLEVVGSPWLVLRRWEPGDAESLVHQANDRGVWLNLRDLFPHPYTLKDAHAWIGLCATQGDPPRNLAIEVEGEIAGGIGLERGADVYRLSAEVGYWLGRRFWGRGIATAALIRFTSYAFERFDFVRLHAAVFDYNPASARVLEKAGYVFEARRRQALVKDGRIADELAYYRLR